MKLKKIIGIYKITNPNGKVYIGQSVDCKDRLEIDYKNLSCKKQPKIYNSLKKYGVENHQFEVIEECPLEYLDKLEFWWKIFYNSVEDGLNCHYIDGKGGYKSEETKQKISKTKLEYYKTHSGNTKGMKFIKSKETCEKISKSNKGKRKSEEHKKNMGLCRLGKPTKRHRTIIQYDLEGNFIREWNKIKEAALFLGVSDGNIICCAKGIQKTAYGYIWKYKE